MGKRLHKRLAKVFDIAIKRELYIGQNPAEWKGHLNQIIVVKKNKGDKHRKALPFQERHEFMKRLDVVPGMSVAGLRFTILTAVQVNEALGPQWDEIDFDKALWTIPEQRMKSPQEQVILLSEQALTLLRELKELRRANFIFYGARASDTISDATVRAVIKRLGLADRCTTHGFRSTFAD